MGGMEEDLGEGEGRRGSELARASTEDEERRLRDREGGGERQMVWVRYFFPHLVRLFCLVW